LRLFTDMLLGLGLSLCPCCVYRGAYVCTICAPVVLLLIRRPPRSALFPTRRSSDLQVAPAVEVLEIFDGDAVRPGALLADRAGRSEEHTSELSHVSISYAVFCLKKKMRYDTPLTCAVCTTS